MPKRTRSRGAKKSIGVLPPQAPPIASYPPLPPGVIPRSPLGDALIRANLLSIDRGYPVNSIEAARMASIPPNGPPGSADIGIGSPAYEGLVRGDPRFREFEYQYNQVPAFQQLGNLTAQSLVNIPSTGRRLAPTAGPLAHLPVNYGNLEGVNFNTAPVAVPNTNPPQMMDYYDFDSKSPTFQRMVLSPARDPASVHPLITFNHEGRHAIDDLYKKPHQREMINFLAAEERSQGAAPVGNPRQVAKAYKQSRPGWLKPLLDGAQNVIPVPTFNADYPYSGGKGSFELDVNKSLNNLRASKRSPPIPGFQGAKATLDNIRNRPPGRGGQQTADTGDAFKSFSEFPAFMTETLNRGWARFGTQGIPDASRRFIKENLRTMYRDYDELSGSGGAGGVPNSLATQYPQVHQDFFDRYNELRNPNYGQSLSVGPSQKPAYFGKTRQEASLEKMGAPPVPAGSLPILPPAAPQVPKPALTAFTPGINGAPSTPNAFPAPKYTERAKGGHVTKAKSKKHGLFSYFNG